MDREFSTYVCDELFKFCVAQQTSGFVQTYNVHSFTNIQETVTEVSGEHTSKQQTYAEATKGNNHILNRGTITLG